jgi:exonuclease III
MNSITLSSLNCQGLRDNKKRRDVFHYLKNKSHSIYCLQDTHFDTKIEKYITSEWGYTCLFASYKSNARGVAVLFNNNFEFKIKKVERAVNGNFIIILLTTEEKDILLVNIYGPNKDDANFYEDLKERIIHYDHQGLIIVGDWNLVFDPVDDYDNYINVNNPKARENVEHMINDLNLTDIWRENNPQVKRFTWRRSSPVKQSRLDFFLLNENLVQYYKDADIVPGYRTDHSMVILKLQFGKDVKRKTFWKFNSSLLKDKEYVEEINQEINNVILEYAAENISQAALNEKSIMDIHLTVSDKIFIDFLLMKLRSKTIAYATHKKRKTKETEERLIREIESLDKNITEEHTELLKQKNQELVKLRDKRIEGVIIRSRSKWIAEGEKITNYFCNLEKNTFCK